MKSQLYSPSSPFPFLEKCQKPQPKEMEAAFVHKGRTYRIKVKTHMFIEDPYLNMVKAYAYEIKTAKPVGYPPNKRIKDYFVKDKE